MNLNDTISELFTLGCVRVTYGLDDRKELCLAAEQVVKTQHGVSNHVHQVKGEALVDLAVNALVLVKHCASSKSEILTIKRPNGR